jgi:hypothetical protein
MTTMGRLEWAMFASNKNMVVADAANIEVTNFEMVMDKVLQIFKWTRTMVACIGLANGRKQEDQGQVPHQLGEDKPWGHAGRARNVWMEADPDTILSLTFPQAGRAPKPVMLVKLVSGVGAFCIRLVCQLSKASSAWTRAWQQYTALIFLERKAAAIMQRGRSNDPRWLGLRLCEGEITLLLRPTDPWQCPALPMLWSWILFESLSIVPLSYSMRRAISSIMNKRTVRSR